MIRTDSRANCIRTITRTILILPFLVAPFALWTCETWLQMQIFSNDYELTTMRSDQERIRANIEQLEDRASRLKTLSKLEASVPNMGLVEPEPGQIRVIRMSESDLAPHPTLDAAPHRYADADIFQDTQP